MLEINVARCSNVVPRAPNHQLASMVTTPSNGREGLAGRHRRLPRHRRRAVVVILVLILTFTVATIRLFVLPVQGMPAQVSAIVMLAGPGDRLPLALRLATDRRAKVLVVSRGAHGYSGPCPPRPSGVQLICFDPDPADTRGEAEFVGRLAKRYGWSSVDLVVSSTQATRARLLVERCFSGPVYVSTAPLPLNSWPYQIVYGWAALMKAIVVQPSC